MLSDPVRIRRLLAGIARRVSGDPSTHEDMVQEAMIHLWQRIEKHPGQECSWYLQSCRDHLRNYVRRGRSIDSYHRQRTLAVGEAILRQVEFDLSPSGDDVMESVCARDLVEELSRWLTPNERRTLLCLADGLSHREAANRLGTSHTTINNHRRTIANLYLTLNDARRGLGGLRFSHK